MVEYVFSSQERNTLSVPDLFNVIGLFRPPGGNPAISTTKFGSYPGYPHKEHISWSSGSKQVVNKKHVQNHHAQARPVRSYPISWIEPAIW